MNLFAKYNFLKTKNLVVLILSFFAILFMLFNFCRNSFKITEQKWFDDWQADSEWLVRHRMWDDDTKGFSYNYGLLGSNGNWQKKEFSEKHGAYTAQIGLQGFAFGVIYKITHSFGVCHWATALLFILCIFAILKWIYDEFGLVPAVFSYLFVFFNQWIIVSARNLYWVIWTLILPMIILLYCLKYEEKGNKLNFKTVALLEALAIFIKSACGYEFITLVMINMELPLFYYAYKNKWDYKTSFKRFGILAGAAFAGFFLAMFICLVQVYFYSNHSWKNAFEALAFRIAKRIGGGNIEELPEVYHASLNASKISIIEKYFNGGHPLFFNLRMNSLIYICIIGILLSFISGKVSKRISNARRKLLSLDLMVLISFLGPLSWFVLASGHSYVHTHINYLLWSMPFLIFNGCVLFSSVSYIIVDLFEKYKISFCAVLACLFFMTAYFYCNSFSYPLKLKKNAAENGKALYDSENVSVYLYKDSLYYIVSNKNDNTKRYFLHFHTDDKQVQEKIKYGFVNRDFSFSNCEMRLPFWSRHRMAVIKIPDDFYVTKIGTGQFEEKIRFWQTNVPVYEYFDDIRNFSLINLTDNNWSHGFHRKSNILLVKSNDISYKYLIGKTIELPDGSQAKITNVRREGQYYHIHTDKYLMIDSNNVQIKIIEETKQ